MRRSGTWTAQGWPTAERRGRDRVRISPRCSRVNGIRIAFFAVTDLMNGPASGWKDLVARADTAGLLPAIRAVRESTDVVVVSLSRRELNMPPTASERERESSRVEALWRAERISSLATTRTSPTACMPKVRGRKWAVHSLGNFVFMQPDRYWTRFSFAISFDILRDATGTRIRSLRALPLRAGFQPEFLPPGGRGRNHQGAHPVVIITGVFRST
jgi:hypothetical protein